MYPPTDTLATGQAVATFPAGNKDRKPMFMAFTGPTNKEPNKWLLVVGAEQDQSVLAAPALHAAERAPVAEVVRVPGGHYAPFLAEFEPVVTAELDFLQRHLQQNRYLQ